jgi:hypothetical protein
MKRKAITQNKSLSDSELLERARRVYTHLQDNPLFPAPFIPLDTLLAAIESFATAYQNAQEGTKEDTAIKNEQRKALESLLTSEADYVNAIANGNEVTIDSSGFALSALPTPIGILPAPDRLQTTDGSNPGEIEVSFDKVDKATGYLILYTDQDPQPADHNAWTAQLNSRTKLLITSLKSGVKYYFKVGTVTRQATQENRYNFTQVVSRIAQ